MSLRRAAAAGLACLCVLALAVPAAAGPAEVPGGLRAAPDAGYEVTLASGDRVRVGADRSVGVAPAPRPDGRRPMFSVSQRGRDLYVIPDDRRSGDLERYNVTALHEGRRAAAKPDTSGDGYVTVRFKAVARDGRPGRAGVTILNVADGSDTATRYVPGDPSLPCDDWLSTCVRVRPGRYSVLGVVKTMPSWQPSTAVDVPLNVSLVGSPEMEIGADTEIVLDARRATEVRVDTPDHPTKRTPGSWSSLGWMRAPAHGPAVKEEISGGSSESLEGRVFVQPSERVRTGSFELFTRWRLEAPDITMRADGVTLSPQYYRRDFFAGFDTDFPRLDGKVRLRTADADRPDADLRGRLALVRRTDGVPVGELANRAAARGARMVAVYNDKPGINGDPGGSGIKLAVPTVWLSHEEGRALLRRGDVTVTATGVASSPYAYQLLYPEKGRIPAKPHYVARTRNLARIENRYHRSDAATISVGRDPIRPWEEYVVSEFYALRGGPRAWVEYVSADPETSWTSRAFTPEESYNPGQFPDDPKTPRFRFEEGVTRAYRPGERRTHTWFEAPLTGGMYKAAPIVRNGDLIRVRLGVTDAAGNFSDAHTSDFPAGFTAELRAYKDGELVGRTDGRGGYLSGPPEEATYRLEYDVDNRAAWARHATRIRNAWTFRSAHTTESELLPLLKIEYDAGLDLDNRARSRWLNLAVRYQDGERAHVRKVGVEASYDHGATWTKVPVHRRHGDYAALLKGRGTVSLRVSAEDGAGSTITQETVDAYDLR